MSRPIQARIDLSALEYNLQVVRKRARARVMAVIKANAYGHGLMMAADALRSAEGFALLDIADAIKLREAGYRQVLLLLEGAFRHEDMPLLAQHDISTVIHSKYQLDMLDAYPRRGGLSVWLKVNTGMNRLGFAPEEMPAVMARLKEHAAIKDVTLMTHFANADIAAGIAPQLEKFEQVSSTFRGPRSLANSATVLRFPQAHGDWVRPGIMLYGSSPLAEQSAADLGLRPVMTLSSELISVREIKSGEQVGYGGMYFADRNMKIGVVACGYADGYPRHAPNGTPILVNGQKTGTVGRVSMDMLAADISAIADARIGSPVSLWGEGLSVDEVAHAAGTIGYELLTALAPRVPKKG